MNKKNYEERHADNPDAPPYNTNSQAYWDQALKDSAEDEAMAKQQKEIEENQKGKVKKTLDKIKGGIGNFLTAITPGTNAWADEEFPSVESPTYEITYDSWFTREKKVKIVETDEGFDVFVNGVKEKDIEGDSFYTNGESIEDVIKSTERRFDLPESNREDIRFSKGTSSSEWRKYKFSKYNPKNINRHRY